MSCSKSFFYYVVVVAVSCAEGKNASDLLDFLFRDYLQSVRPANGFNESVIVHFKLYLNDLIDVDEVSQKIDSKSVLYHHWTDLRLTWDPEEYDGIKLIRVQAEKLWLPIFVLYNNADGDFAVSEKFQAKVLHNGSIEWAPPALFSSFCEIQVANFPFDTQNCTMKLGPWTRGMDLLDMVNMDGNVTDHKCEPPVTDNYRPNGEWSLLTTGCYKHYIAYNCCYGPYVDMTYHFVIQRNPLNALMSILIPTFLFGILSSAVFYLPSGGGEKMSLSVSVLLTFVLFLLVIVDTIPSTANGVPLLGTYILFTMIMATLSIIITVFELNVYYRTPAMHDMPGWMRKVFIKILPQKMMSATIKVMPKEKKSDKTPDILEVSDVADISGRKNDKESSLMLNPDFRAAVNNLDTVAQRYRSVEEKSKGETEWQYVAMVMDRYFLKIFTIAFLLGTVVIFAKRLFELSYEKEMFQNNDGKCLLNCKADE